MESSKRITRCPTCGTKYLVPENTLHKSAPCLKCGNRFKIFFEEAPVTTPVASSKEETAVNQGNGPAAENLESAAPEAGEGSQGTTGSDWEAEGFQLRISEDALTATLKIPEAVPAELTVEALKAWLTQKGVVYGLSLDADLDRLLGGEENRGQEAVIAAGTPARSGQDGRIEYHFDLEASKVGTVRLDGAIDFKDKGEIPQVTEGALLAEKIPSIPGVAGMNIFGQTLSPEAVRDVLLLAGENARSSEDGLQVFAKTCGRPALNRDGRIVVYPELRIDGDVGLETGHIQFNGHIKVSGIIQEGYRVKGGQLTAREIDKAAVDIEGDIQVNGGIIGSKIKSKGTVMARYVEASGIQALGDVIIRDEVLHSVMDVHGQLQVTSSTGKILSSDITARKGIEAAFIGSDASRPCNLVIGVDTQAAGMIHTFKVEIKEKQQKLEKLGGLIEKLKLESNNYAGQIAQLAQVQDRGILEQRPLKALLDELETNNDLNRLAQARFEYDGLEKKIRGAEESLNHLMEEQDHNTEKIFSSQKEIGQLNQSIQELNLKIERIQEQSAAEKIDPVLRVRQTMSSGTVIKGKQACLILPQDAQRVQFKEKRLTTTKESGPPISEWLFGAEDLT
ncbi:MAG: DUF342 domain-containing protein [Deltaproteobacteria bacterium]|nr:DUF342 domain-containing protein [Deltaproteobacteria bacterium]